MLFRSVLTSPPSCVLIPHPKGHYRGGCAYRILEPYPLQDGQSYSTIAAGSIVLQ